MRIVDGNQHQLVWQYYSSNDISFDLPFYDNFGDNYSILVSANGYKQAGYQPVTLSDAYLTTLNINLCKGISQINLAQGTPLSYIKQLIWDGDTLPPGAEPPAQDRFFAWCDTTPIDQGQGLVSKSGLLGFSGRARAARGCGQRAA